MTFYGLSPWAGLGLALGTLAILTATHFLHRRYQRVTVPALRFWSAALKRHRQDTLTGRFRHPLTWLLLCALAGLLILSMLQPGPSDPRPWVIVLDCRASMALPTEQGPTRLERSQALLQDFLQDSTGPQAVTLIAVNETACVLTQPQDRKAESLLQLQQCATGSATTDQGMHQALKLAQALADQDDRTGVLLCTDHVTLDDLPSQWHVLNVAPSTDNLALLEPELFPSAHGTYRLEIWMAHWGPSPCQATLELRQGDQIRQSQAVTLAPQEMRAVNLTVRADEIDNLHAQLIRDEAFTLDNQMAPVVWQRCRLVLPEKMPLALQAAIEANPAYLVTAPDQADVCMRLDQSDPCDVVEHYQAIRITQALCADEHQRQAWMTDLFVGPQAMSVPTTEQDIILLQTESGQVLATRSRTRPAMLSLSPSLFGAQATFWKQAQYLPILDAMLAVDNGTPEGPVQVVTSNYSDLTQPVQSTAQPVQSTVKGQNTLTAGLLILALLLAGWELFCFYWGKIV